MFVTLHITNVHASRLRVAYVTSCIKMDQHKMVTPGVMQQNCYTTCVKWQRSQAVEAYRNRLKKACFQAQVLIHCKFLVRKFLQFLNSIDTYDVQV